jgi:membrane protein
MKGERKFGIESHPGKSPASIRPTLTLKQAAVRLAKSVYKDDVFGQAAKLAYYFLLSMVPLLIFFTALLGMMAQHGTALRDNLLRYFSALVPGSASALVYKIVDEIGTGSSGGKLSFGIITTLWAASSGMAAMFDSLNMAYDVKESRPWWKTRLLAIALTIGLSIMVAVALALLLKGGEISEYISSRLGFGRVFMTTWTFLQWPIMVLSLFVAFFLLYDFAPNVRRQRLRWVWPGAALGVALWLIVSFGFRLYFSFFDTYNVTYGSLGAVVVLMLWFYLSGLAILIGGELNAELEHAAAEAGVPTARHRGRRNP